MNLYRPFARCAKKVLMGVGAAAKAGDRAVILRYHSVKRVPANHAATVGLGIIHSETDFASQMELLSTRYNPVTLAEIYAFLVNHTTLPPRAVAVTFDDGFADNFEIAAPILDRYGIKAAFYVTTDHIGNATIPWFTRLRHVFAVTQVLNWSCEASQMTFNLTDEEERQEAFLEACKHCARAVGEGQERFMVEVEAVLGRPRQKGEAPLMMDWAQVRDLIDRGHIIGSHTCSHPNLAQMSPDDVYKELKSSLELLEKRTSSRAPHFSYPSPVLQPHYNGATVEITRKLGLLTAVTCTSGAVGRGDEPLSLKRIWVPDHPVDFRWEIEKAFCAK